MEQSYDHRLYHPGRYLGQFIWYVLDLLVALLALRLVLRLLAANTDAGFTRFIYGVTAPLASPFSGVISPTELPGGAVMEWSSLLAILVYWIAASIIIRLLSITWTSPQPVSVTDTNRRPENPPSPVKKEKSETPGKNNNPAKNKVA